MAGDYRRLTRGRHLVVGRLETGSIVAVFWDQVAPYASNALDILRGAKGVADFAKSVIELYGTAKKISTKQDEQVGTFIGGRSVEAIIKIAAESHCEIDFDFSATDQPSLHLRVRPFEAIQIRAKNQALLSARQKKKPARLKGPSPQLALSDFGKVAGSLAKFPALESTERILAIISAFVAAFEHDDLAHRLELLANELDRLGRSDIADLVRAATSMKSGAAIEGQELRKD